MYPYQAQLFPFCILAFSFFTTHMKIVRLVSGLFHIQKITIPRKSFINFFFLVSSHFLSFFSRCNSFISTIFLDKVSELFTPLYSQLLHSTPALFLYQMMCNFSCSILNFDHNDPHFESEDFEQRLIFEIDICDILAQR